MNILPLPQTKPCLVGESPHWDAPTQSLYWVDIYGKAIFQYELNKNQINQIDLPEMVGPVIPISKEEVMVCMPSGIYKLQLSNKKLDQISELEPQLPNNRPNDGKYDPQGRLWVGTCDLEFKPGASSLYRLDSNGHLTQVLKGLTLANGMAWDTVNNIFYFIDSSVQSIYKFNYHPQSGDISGGSVAFSYDQSFGIPDGMCIDSEGMLWIVGFGRGNVSQFNPKTGKLIKKIELPTPYPTACAFGGKDLNQLFVTSASHLVTDKNKDAYSGLTYMITF
ncbi:SMP-30/gluconolactonase/LRE family protein [Legionella oakridgensis]|uniref:L-arabinolactonase n=1 Tax=Legionella oakridgensis TaxID=29423 RepID=A0A0W0X5I7_9GAMM|nr:SMP-30/gluconolactonase/LRE family protein [Legionella oakridgensis]KTD39821.1 L-arabinolactonase [Legionella oakridgensis]STY19899.1 Gluconolactonase [Legionella longbeachae]